MLEQCYNGDTYISSCIGLNKYGLVGHAYTETSTRP